MKGIECAFFGSAAKPIELRTSKAGNPWCSLSVGVETGDVREDGSTHLEWVKVSVFGAQAEALAMKVEKGTRLYVEGVLRPERWQTSEGEHKFTLAVAASKCDRVGASAIGRNKPRRDSEPSGKPSFAASIEREPNRSANKGSLSDPLPF
jgi:single-strand DNA-binding protein